MKIIEPGHIYELNWLDEDDLPKTEELKYQIRLSKQLTFVNREPGHEHPGTQVQEVLRALIDRTFHCDYCMPHELNAMIIHHLRMALVYHEMRAMERKTEKGLINPENIVVGKDGHFDMFIKILPEDDNVAPRREFQLKVPEKECKRRQY